VAITTHAQAATNGSVKLVARSLNQLNRRTNLMEWDNCVKTENFGMAGGYSYYTMEDIYQAIKERLVKELNESEDKPDVTS
jgi:hypothetical protein